MATEDSDYLRSAKDRVREHGFTVSAGSWEDDEVAYACSVETLGPEYYGQPRFEFLVYKQREALSVSFGEAP